MDLEYRAIKIEQEGEDVDEMDITTLEKQDQSYSYIINENDWNRIKNEPSMDSNKQSELILDTEKHIKLEEVLLAVDIKVEEQESETYMESTKLELLTEDFYIKPEKDISYDRNSCTELDRVVKENTRGKEYGVVCRKSNKRSFICYHCNFIVYTKKDLINHIHLGNCRLKGDAEKISTQAHVRLFQSKEYICVKCHKIFKSEAALDNHVINNHEGFIASVSSKIHQCKYCSYKTTYSSRLASHMTKHPESGYSVELIPCLHCDKTFKSKQACNDHVIKNHTEFIGTVSSKIHKCNHCSYKTIYLHLLIRHMEKHPESMSSIKRFPCINCDKTFKSKQVLDDHVIKNHEEFIASVSSKIHQCKHCSYKTTDSTKLANHMGKHPESGCSVKQYQCIYCDQKFKRKVGLDDHVIKKHTEFIGSVSSKIHECKHCSYKTTNSTLLTRHMRKHPESGCSVKVLQCLERFQCIHCDKIFKSKRSLDDHVIKKHEEFIESVSYKIHQCKHCSYKTTDSTILDRHMNKHPESGCSVKQYPCIHCDRTFRCKQVLDDHVIKNHKEYVESVSYKIHQCEHCSYKTTDSSKLARHMKKHLESGCGVKQYLCIHCDKTFKRKMTLDDHVVRNHEECIPSVSSKVHQCEHCSYKTTYTTLLAKHMRSHT